jgi:hypothetical protein
MAVFAGARDNPAMVKCTIFSLSAGVALGLCATLALAQGQLQGQLQGQDPDSDLKAKKPPHEQALEQIERERLAFAREISQREQVCLKKFFSASCLDKVTTDHLQGMREFDLRREAERQALREIDAELRARSRERRAPQS